jgi:transitional endoplasmic reticulum ATPase
MTFHADTQERLSIMPSASLFPAQQRALDALEVELTRSAHVALSGMSGTGKSLIAQRLAAQPGAVLFSLDDYLAPAAARPYDKWGERLFPMLHEALARHPMLILDDYMFCLGTTVDSERAAEERRLLCQQAEALGHKLVMIGRPTILDWEDDLTEEMMQSSPRWWYGTHATPIVHLPARLMPEDLAALATLALGAERVDEVDFEILHIHAAHLQPRTFKMICALFGPDESVTTQTLLQKIGDYILNDTLGLGEVETLTFETLPGTEAIAQALETHVVIPFRYPHEAERLGVKAQRGIMLFGPPGTGKTSVGRALAHRLKGKFFLIDGSIPTEPPQRFLSRVMAIIERAIANAPSVLFIDDADNLLSIPYVAGVVRKLLSLLDGMESESASKVCVMMTVMDPIHIPDALLRSGRVELWLETSPPDAAIRAAMFERWNSGVHTDSAALDTERLAARSAGFTPADIRRVMEDMRLLQAQDHRAGIPMHDATTYALEAIEAMIAMRAAMAGVLHDDTLRLGEAAQEEMAA